MTEFMINLRRSPRKLLERDGHPGPGPGRLAMVLARAGVGKTAFLVDIGLDALLSGQRVLHITLDGTVEKVRTWYDDILSEMLRDERKLDHWGSIQLDVERRRHVHAYHGEAFTVDRLRTGIELLADVMHFKPQVILLDGMESDGIDTETISGVKAVAKEIGAELWMACQTFRDGPETEDGHLPSPVHQIEDLVDLAFRLDSHGSKIRLHVLKDHDEMLDKDLHILLDPRTLLIRAGFGV